MALSAFVCEYYRQSDGHPKPQAQGKRNTCISAVSLRYFNDANLCFTHL